MFIQINFYGPSDLEKRAAEDSEATCLEYWCDFTFLWSMPGSPAAAQLSGSVEHWPQTLNELSEDFQWLVPQSLYHVC